MRRVSSCLMSVVWFTTSLGALTPSEAAPGGGRGVATAQVAAGAGRAGFAARGGIPSLPTGAGFIPVGLAGGTVASGRYGSGPLLGSSPFGFNGLVGSRSMRFGYGSGVFGTGRGSYGARSYGFPFGYGGCFECGGPGVQQTILPGAFGVPSAAGIRDAPVSPPAIYVIGARTRPGRHGAVRQGAPKVGEAGRTLSERPGLAAGPASGPKTIRLDERS